MYAQALIFGGTLTVFAVGERGSPFYPVAYWAQPVERRSFCFKNLTLEG